MSYLERLREPRTSWHFTYLSDSRATDPRMDIWTAGRLRNPKVVAITRLSGRFILAPVNILQRELWMTTCKQLHTRQLWFAISYNCISGVHRSVGSSQRLQSRFPHVIRAQLTSIPAFIRSSGPSRCTAGRSNDRLAHSREPQQSNSPDLPPLGMNSQILTRRIQDCRCLLPAAPNICNSVFVLPLLSKFLLAWCLADHQFSLDVPSDSHMTISHNLVSSSQPTPY